MTVQLNQTIESGVLRSTLFVAAAISAITMLPRPSSSSEASPAAIECETISKTGALQIEADCTDAEFSRPVIDDTAEISDPVTLHKVSGHFEGTEVKFNFYFPPKDRWKGRFFHNVYPLTTGEARAETLIFGSESGAYTVQTGGSIGYRADAAAAKFSREVARDYYGEPDRKIYGYIYGGSGGSYQTIGAMENSKGVWDGAVPYVIGTPTSIPNNFFIRAFARHVLAPKSGEIADAMAPGGNGDPYRQLNHTERAVLEEVSAMGVPLKGWDHPGYLLGLEDAQGLMGFRDTVRGIDPTYASDFWSKPGYLGTEQSALGDLIRSAKVDVRVPIVEVEASRQTLTLERAITKGDPRDFEYELIDARGNSLGLLPGKLNIEARSFDVSDSVAPALRDRIIKAATLRITNEWSLALGTYHRHQIPHAPDITAWDQFAAPDGTPKFPQRKVEIGPVIGTGASGGASYDGNFEGKMIVVGNLLDLDAFPWHANWYAGRVKKKLGSLADDRFRVWINDNADHHDGSVIVSGKSDGEIIRLVSYVGIVQQAVKDVSAWVETGEAPASSTTYDLTNGQVSVPNHAQSRQGIQPVVKLSANGEASIAVSIGETVTLNGSIELPGSIGEVTAIEWSRSGRDNFEKEDVNELGPQQPVIQVQRTFSYDKPGTYFPVLRATVERNPGNASGHVMNLDRIRVVVR